MNKLQCFNLKETAGWQKEPALGFGRKRVCWPCKHGAGSGWGWGPGKARGHSAEQVPPSNDRNSRKVLSPSGVPGAAPNAVRGLPRGPHSFVRQVLPSSPFHRGGNGVQEAEWCPPEGVSES